MTHLVAIVGVAGLLLVVVLGVVKGCSDARARELRR